MTIIQTKQAQNVQAVLALFRGDSVEAVSERFQISRSDLYKFKRLAYAAIVNALGEYRRGPKRPYNRIEDSKEQAIVALCQRYSTFSAHQIAAKLGKDAPSLRTIQRIRKRNHLKRFTKRAPSSTLRRKIPPYTAMRVRELLHEKPYLGPLRIVWDMRNSENLKISASTVKRLKKRMLEAMKPLPPPPLPPKLWKFYERHHPHSLWHGDFLEKVTLTDCGQTAYQLALMDDYSRGYVFCDLFLAPDVRTTIRALIAAMRQWKVIPKAVLFDNGAHFKGKLLVVFCKRVGIRLTHSAVYHPQTNGKLEREFRDDMRDFYKQYDVWHIDQLRHDLPEYVHYLNYVRGRQALGGKPSITRLRKEHSCTASSEILENLESYASYEVGRKVVPSSGKIRMFDRDAILGTSLANVEVTFFETLDGLEARVDGLCVMILREYRTCLQLISYRKTSLPPVLVFEPYQPPPCP